MSTKKQALQAINAVENNFPNLKLALTTILNAGIETDVALDLSFSDSSATDLSAITIDQTNAGAGDAIGIDLTSANLDAIFSAPANAITTAGTVSHQIPVKIGGTIFYLVAYTAGS